MGAGMDKVLPGLYVGSIKDAKDVEQLRREKITHILSIHEDAKNGSLENVEYLCFKASDHANQDIKMFFDEAIEFIHQARLNNGNVLVHCLAGISRSTTLTIAYIMTITEMPWYDSLNAVRAARKGANPNFGFQRQLQNFEFTSLKMTREKLFSKFGNYDHKVDLEHCQSLLESYKSQQATLTSTSRPTSYQVNSPKTYPLAFNAYGLDKDDAKKTNLVRNHKVTDSSEKVEENDEANKDKESV